MFALSDLGKWFLFTGMILSILGGLIWVSGKTGLPFGRLPGDIRIDGEGWSLFVPLVSCLLLSFVLTIGLNLIMRLFSK
jgi:hypothetical protein